MNVKKFNIEACFEQVKGFWDPHIIGQLNGQHVKIARIRGPFVWHAHDNEDELFLVISGSFDMELRDQVLHLEKGDMVIIPRGVEHRPNAAQEAQILLFEPAGTLNTGNTLSELTREKLKTIT